MASAGDVPEMTSCAVKDNEYTGGEAPFGTHSFGMPEGDEQERLITALYKQMRATQEHIERYTFLGAFLLFTALYFTILHFQAGTLLSYQIAGAHTELLPPAYTGTSPVTFPNAPTDVFNWINSSIIQNVWAPPPCGDGQCSTPAEYPSFGRFGCTADCGVEANLTSIDVVLSNNFASDLERSSSSWNLVLDYPVYRLWFAKDQQFADLSYENNVTTLNVPDGHWSLLLNAPYGGVRGVIKVEGANASDPAALFGGCLADQGPYALCKEISAAIAAYLTSTCAYGTFYNNTRALLYLDWVGLCAAQPETVIQLVNSTGNYTPTMEYMASIGIEPFNQYTILQCACPPSVESYLASPSDTCNAIAELFTDYGVTLASFLAANPGKCNVSNDYSVRPFDVLCLPTTSGPAPAPAPASALAAPISPPPSAPGSSSSNFDYYGAGVDPRETSTEWAAHAHPDLPLWEALGPTNSTRNASLSVAMYRAWNTWAVDPCLTYYTQQPQSNHRLEIFIYNWTALFIGAPQEGNVSFTYTKKYAIQNVTDYDSEEKVLGDLLFSTRDLVKELYDAHSGLVGPDALDRFLSILLAGMFSSTRMTEATQVAFYNWFDHLGVSINRGVHVTTQSCDQPDFILNWATGSILTTEVLSVQKRGYVILQWIWTDDNPHSIRAMNYERNSLDYPAEFGVDRGVFLGIGGETNVLSRKTACTPENAFFQAERPYLIIPCALATPQSPAGTFSYASSFNPMDFQKAEYGSDGLSDGLNYGYLNLIAAAGSPAPAPSPASSAAGNATFGSFYTCGLAIGDVVCNISKIFNGYCNPECDQPDCLFDGGDCSCAKDSSGIGQCSCPGNQSRVADDGSCCFSDALGNNLAFGFKVQTYGPNVLESDSDFVPSGTVALQRSVANSNILLVGMLLSTERARPITCPSESRFSSIVKGSSCQGPSYVDPWGIASQYLPQSILYNRTYALATAAEFEALNATNYPNSTYGFNFNGSPNGFFNATVKKSDNTTASYGLNYIFDVNLNLGAVTKLLQYVVDGYFVDSQTTSLTIELVTYNALEGYFTLVHVRLHFESGGSVTATCSVDTTKVAFYRSGEDTFRMVLEVLFALALAWMLVQEVKQMVQITRRTRHIMNYFEDVWSYVDIASICIMLACCALWIYIVTILAEKYQATITYSVYRTLPGDYFRLLEPSDTRDGSSSQLPEALAVFENIRHIVKLKTIYFALHGANIFLMMLRTLKFMDFQPRIGTITRTLAEASTNLFHYFIVVAVIFVGYGFFGNIAFGALISEFRTLPVTFNTMINALNGDDTPDTYFVQLQGWNAVVGVLYWWSFIILMVYVTFNCLIAIIVDAYAKVESKVENAPSMPTELWFIFNDFVRRLFREQHKSHRQIAEELKHLGATRDEARHAGHAHAEEDETKDSHITVGEGVYAVANVKRAIRGAAEMRGIRRRFLSRKAALGEEEQEEEEAGQGEVALAARGERQLETYADFLTSAVVSQCTKAVGGELSSGKPQRAEETEDTTESRLGALEHKMEHVEELLRKIDRQMETRFEQLFQRMGGPMTEHYGRPHD